MATRQEARAPVQELFSFMKLPVELRLRVYREVLQTELRSEQQVIIDDSGICGVDNEVYDPPGKLLFVSSHSMLLARSK
jgi:hypothetical protein